MKKSSILIVIISLFFACQVTDKSESAVKDGPLNIVCTTGMLGDAVRNIVGESAEVKTLMGPGVDPHLYKATQGDLELLSNADIIIYNGLHLEGKMGEIFEKLSERKTILAAGDAIKKPLLINNTDFQGAHDPHIWFDVLLWKKVVLFLGDKIESPSDSLNKVFKKNARSYAVQLDSLHQEISLRIKEIPEKNRILVTAHDAFGYFGRAYFILVKGLQGISTVSEYGLQDVSQLVQFITQHEVNAVFVESSVPERALKAVIEGCEANGHQLSIGGTLFSDAMGEEGTPEGTYIGMVRHNVNLIVSGLKKEEN